MNPSETAFLVLGLLIGVAVGAAVWQVVRARPAPRREVRLTVTPNSVPARRPSTLATPGGAREHGPLPGSPDGDAHAVEVTRSSTAIPAAATVPVAQPRTSVPNRPAEIASNAVAVPIVADEVAAGVTVAGVGPSGPAALQASSRAGTGSPATIGVPVGAVPVRPVPTPGAPSPGAPTGLAAVPPPAPDVPDAARARASAVSESLARSARAVAVLEAPRPRTGGDDRALRLASATASMPVAGVAAAGGVTAAGASVKPAASGLAVVATSVAVASGQEGRGGASRDDAAPIGAARAGALGGSCTDERRLVDERCAVADAAREEARRTAEALRAGQRAYDDLRERVEKAQELADPRRVAETKSRLHASFRAASEGAGNPDEAEAAARAWLDAINRLNGAVREAGRLAETGTAELGRQLPVLDRLGLEAEASRIAADHAAEACQEARERLAACEEDAVRALAASAVPAQPEDEHPFANVWPVDEPAYAAAQALDASGSGVSSIIAVLRGDRGARDRIVAAIAGPDADDRRVWQLRLAALVDAISARAIEDGYLDLPEDDAFWGLFGSQEAREIVAALSALGFRYDGMGGFSDGRVPATRDLSLAVGYAGLDRMRIRTWPREEVMARLLERAHVASDAWLVAQAGDLSLGRMVDALGARAAALAELWNAWGRVRPILLAE